MAILGPNIPLLIGLLMAVVAVEQIYLFYPLYNVFKITKERDLIIISSPFMLIFIGALTSSIVDCTLIFLPYNIAEEILATSTLVRSVFEIFAFSLLIAIPRFRRREITLAVLPLFYLGVIPVLLAVLSVLLILHLRRFLSREGGMTDLILMVGILLLITSKAVLIYPTTMLSAYAKEFISSVMEMFGLSNFLILREVITSSMRPK